MTACPSCNAEEVLAKKTLKNTQKINKAVLFHTVKNQAFEMLFDDEDNIDLLLERLRQSYFYKTQR